MRYRFAFDVGTNSLGWAVYELNLALEPIDLTDAGVRIFSDGRDPKRGDSLAVERRGQRAMRRRRDRYLQRRTYLMDELIKAGLMPAIESDRKALEKSDPYGLRSKGLDHALTLHEFGRALFHLNQRRGFQSNRIADASKDDWTDGMFCNSAMSIRDQSGSPRLKLSKNALSWSVSVTFIASFRRVRVATKSS